MWKDLCTDCFFQPICLRTCCLQSPCRAAQCQTPRGLLQQAPPAPPAPCPAGTSTSDFAGQKARPSSYLNGCPKPTGHFSPFWNQTSHLRFTTELPRGQQGCKQLPRNTLLSQGTALPGLIPCTLIVIRVSAPCICWFYWFRNLFSETSHTLQKGFSLNNEGNLFWRVRPKVQPDHVYECLAHLTIWFYEGTQDSLLKWQSLNFLIKLNKLMHLVITETF